MSDLITLQEYKSFMGIAKTDNDDKFSFLISAASDLIQTYIGLTFSNNSTIEEILTVDYETNTLYLENYPIQDVLGLSIVDRYTTDSTVHVPLTYEHDYLVDKQQGTILRNYTVSGLANWPVTPGYVQISYTLPSAFAGGGVPSDIKLAAIHLVKYYEKEEYVPSKSIQGSSITNSDRSNRPSATGGVHFPQHIQVILDRYRQ